MYYRNVQFLRNCTLSLCLNACTPRLLLTIISSGVMQMASIRAWWCFVQIMFCSLSVYVFFLSLIWKGYFTCIVYHVLYCTFCWGCCELL